METKIGTAQKLSDGTPAELHMTSSSSPSFFFLSFYFLFAVISLFFFFGVLLPIQPLRSPPVLHRVWLPSNHRKTRFLKKKKKRKRHIPLSLLTSRLTPANKPQEKAKQRKKKQKQKLQFI